MKRLLAIVIVHRTFVFRCPDTPYEMAYTLKRTDRVPAKEGGGKPESREMIVFVCSGAVSITSGVWFNTLEERQYVATTRLHSPLNPGDEPQTTSIVGFDARSDFTPVIGVLAHVRLFKVSRDVAAHFSLGAGVDSGDDASLELLPGLSLSIKDRLFFTVGPHVGRQVTGQPGFEEGAQLPMDRSDIPTTKRWKAGLGAGVSFKIR